MRRVSLRQGQRRIVPGGRCTYICKGRAPGIAQLRPSRRTRPGGAGRGGARGVESTALHDRTITVARTGYHTPKHCPKLRSRVSQNCTSLYFYTCHNTITALRRCPNALRGRTEPAAGRGGSAGHPWVAWWPARRWRARRWAPMRGALAAVSHNAEIEFIIMHHVS